MKIIKFKEKKNYNYKRKILIKDLVIKILVGIHNFEKKKKQRVRFNVEINIDPNLKPSEKNLDSIVNVVDVVLLVSYIFGESNLSEEQFLNADIDSNSIINVSDIIALIDIILS